MGLGKVMKNIGFFSQGQLHMKLYESYHKVNICLWNRENILVMFGLKLLQYITQYTTVLNNSCKYIIKN